MMRKYLIWFLIGPIIIALGLWGASYMRHKSLAEKDLGQAAHQASGPQPFLPREDDGQPDQATQDRQALTEAINRFRSAKSMRISLTQSSATGTVTGDISYVKPLRMQATLRTPDKQVLDMIIIGETVYVRTGKDTWEMSNDRFAKDYGHTFFASMTMTDSGLSSFGVADDAELKVKNDSAKKCKGYKTKYTTLDKRSYDIEFCVNDQKDIVYIKSQTDGGQITSEYRDYNQMFLIERPRMPLLQLRSPFQDQSATSS